LNHGDQGMSHAKADCASDREACLLAESLIEAGEQAEVWDGLRRVRLIGCSAVSDRDPFMN